jgi:hypothetical protein
VAWIRVAKADHGLADQTGHVHVRWLLAPRNAGSPGLALRARR